MTAIRFLKNSTIAIITIMLLQGCGTITAKDAIKGANAIRNISTISKAGAVERASNCIKDIADPSNRGSRC
jgi:uncharacterized protein YceK